MTWEAKRPASEAPVRDGMAMPDGTASRFALAGAPHVERTWDVPWDVGLGGGRVFDLARRRRMAFFAPKEGDVEWLGADPLLEATSMASLGAGPNEAWPVRPVFFGLPFPGPTADGAFQAPWLMVPAIQCRYDRAAGRVTIAVRTRDEAGAEERLRALAEDAQALLAAAAAEPLDVPAPRVSGRVEWPGRPAWDEAFAALGEAWAGEAMRKVVLARQVDLRLDAEAAWSPLLAYLWDVAEPSFRFAASDGEGHLFVSRSPERLLSWEGRDVRVDAIAGTRPRGVTPAQDAAWARDLFGSAKDMAEHRHVSRFVEGVLGAFSQDVRRERDEALLVLKNVQHCITCFRATLAPGHHPWDVLARLHPTPAVGGQPLAPALAFIQAWEPRPRGWFAGAVGLAGADRGDVAIGIRSAVVGHDQATVFAGAGLVAGSDAGKEWEEIDAKMRTLLAYFHD